MGFIRLGERPYLGVKIGVPGLLGGGFSPRDIDGLVLWLDASDNVTLFQDSAGTTLAANDGDPVGLWQDKSGNNHHVSQPTTSNKPQLKLNIQSGHPIVRGDGTDDYLSRPDALGLIGNPAITVFVVTKSASTIPIAGIITVGSITSSTNGKTLAFCEGTDGISYRFNDGNEVFGTAFFDVFRIGVWARPSGADYVGGDFYLNGVEISATSSGNPTGIPALTNESTRIFCRTASTGAVSDWFGGDIAELLVYAATLSENDRQKVETYLNSKWAVY